MNKGLEVIEAHWLYDVRLRADRRRRPSPEPRPLARRVRRRLAQGPARPPRHAHPHPVRPDLSPARRRRRRRASICWRHARPDVRGARRGALPGARASRAQPGSPGPRATAALIAADEVAVERFLAGTLDFPGIAAPRRGGGRALRRTRRSSPTSMSSIALDAEVRAWAATTAVDGGAGLMHASSTASSTSSSCWPSSSCSCCIHEFGHFVVARRAGVGSTSSASASRRGRASSTGARRRSTRSTGCPSAASCGWKGRRANRTIRAAFVSQPLRHAPGHPARRRGHELPARLAHLHRASRPAASRPCTMVLTELPARRPDWTAPIGHVHDDGTPHLRRSGDLILAIDGQRSRCSTTPRGRTAHADRLPAERAGREVTLTVRHADGTVEDDRR